MASKFRSPAWLKYNGFAPRVYLFHNKESGQVIYSQLPHLSNYQIKVQFKRPNWENKKPTKRRDIWDIMCVAEFADHDAALKLYNGLVELRYMREISKRKEAEALRRRNKDGNIWYSGQFRPTYSQESVLDLSTVIDEFKLPATVYWENLWRKGDDKYWNLDLAIHKELPLILLNRSVILKELAKLDQLDFKKLEAETVEEQ